MKKIKLSPLFFFSFFIIIVLSCDNKHKNKEILKSAEKKDSICIDPICIDESSYTFDKKYKQEDDVKSYNGDWKFFKKNKAKIYFVKKWKTPDFDLKDSTVGLFDGQIIFGCKIKNRVYHIYKYPTRKKYFQETGDSILYSERYFPIDALTKDPRQTYWWISNVLEIRDAINQIQDSLDLHDFVLNSCVLEDDDADFSLYIKNIEKKINQTKGKNFLEKIENWTKETNPEDDFKKWEDVWSWPEYNIR